MNSGLDGRSASTHSPPASEEGTRLVEELAAAEQAARALRHASRAHAALSEMLAAGGRPQEAMAALLAAKDLSPGRAEDHEALAFAAFKLGEHQLARDFYAQVTAMAPFDALAWYNLATSERNLGHLNLAEEACNRALSRDPRLFQAHLLRSQLRTQTADDNHVDELASCLQRNGASAQAQIFLHYALGKELDDLGRFDDAFGHFSRGAHVRRLTLQYLVGQDTQKLKRIMEVFDTDTLRRSSQGSQIEGYGFILGLPRSGTTLIERVLTGRPSVRSNGETDNFSTALLQALAEKGSDVFERAARSDPMRIATDYARRAGAPPAGGLVLEKLPINYLYVGSIHMAMPNSKILLVRRNPMDNCFAMFSTLFGSGYPFSYDLNDLADYYVAYAKLTQHWLRNLPDQILEVSYDAFVEHPQAVGPAIAQHVGLDWTPGMLRIEDNRSASATESAAQIRRPIYKTAAGRWRNYAKQLQPLSDALIAAGVDLTDSA